MYTEKSSRKYWLDNLSMKKSLKWYGGFVAAFAVYLLFWNIDFQDPPTLLRLVGRLHPLIVHFPIGLLLLALFFRVLALRHSHLNDHLVSSSNLIWDLGALSAFLVALSGNALSLEGGFDEDLIYWHKRLGIAVALASIGASLFRRFRETRPGSYPLTFLYYFFVVITSISLVTSGHLGGTMVHGAGYWSDYLPESIRKLVDPFAPRLIHDKSPSEYFEARIFSDLVMPVLNRKCTSCHGATRQEATFRLDSYEELLRGGPNGTVLEPGNPDSSEIIRRVTAPFLDEDHMPPSGHVPLDIGETELLRWWIIEGARKDLRIADSKKVPSAVETILKRRFGYLDKFKTGIYALSIPPLDPASIREARSFGFGIRQISRDYPFVHVDATNLYQDSSGKSIQSLKSLVTHITELNLSRTNLGNDELKIIESMQHLTHLDLSKTPVGDEGLVYLKSLRYLEYLNLFGTRVSNEGLQNLLALPSLKSLYVWQSLVTLDGLEQFRQAMPGIEVNNGLQFKKVSGDKLIR